MLPAAPVVFAPNRVFLGIDLMAIPYGNAPGLMTIHGMRLIVIYIGPYVGRFLNSLALITFKMIDIVKNNEFRWDEVFFFIPVFNSRCNILF